jgi:Tol biopolymer transport system component
LAFCATDVTGKTMLWVRSLGSPPARPLPGTEGASDPFWSADNSSLGYFADNKLKTIAISGGPAVVVADAPVDGGGSWNREGTILFVPDYTKGIYQVSASGGTPAPVIAVDASKFAYCLRPRFLPDGKHFVYVALGSDPATTGVYFASLDGKERRRVVTEGNGALYASRYLLYPRDNTVMAQAFDPERGRLKGDAHGVAQDVETVFGYGLFDVSQNGILVYQRGGAEAEKQLTWFDRAGKNLGATGEVTDYYDVRLAPSGEKLASNAGYPPGSPNSEIWVDELVRGVRMRLTIDPNTDHGLPVWSPDGSTIVFGVLGGKARLGIYRKSSNGAGSEELLLPSESSDTSIWPTSWSHDGRFILYSRGSSALDRADIWVLPLLGNRKPRLLVQAPVAAYDGQFSPNGRWVAYTSKESGREEVYVVPFDATGVLNTGSGSAGVSVGGKWQVSASGGRFPRWRGDCKEIFYLSPDNQMMAAEVKAQGKSIEVRTTQALFRAGVATSSSPYDVTPNGKRFVINTFNTQDTPLTLVVNWTANLKNQ